MVVNAAAGTRPNIVIINCDDLGYGDLACYGSTVNDTPALDRMAAEGIRFTDFYVASPVCSPSRGALMTGCYPRRIGFGDFDGSPVLFPGQPVGLAPTETTVARLLSDAGYATSMVGKWHCGDQPEFLPRQHGFDHYFGLPYSNDMGRQVGTPTDDRGDQPGSPPLPLLDDDDVLEQQPDQAGLTSRYVAEALRFIRAQRDRPFFLYLAHMYVHLPLYVQEQFARSSRNGTYGAAVAAIDWAAAVILHELAALGLDDKTLVIFTSDNGALDRADGGSNLPLRGSKGTTWEGGQRVAAIARWPGRIAPGQVSSALVASIDLYPTLAALAGATVPTDRVIDGLDVLDVLTAGMPSPRQTFAYYWRNQLCAVRDQRWKLHVARRDEPNTSELYDLSTDIGETTDLAARYPEVVTRLSGVAEEFRSSLGDSGTGASGQGVRAIGRVSNGHPLTTYDPAHPYYAAEYDLPDRG